MASVATSGASSGPGGAPPEGASTAVLRRTMVDRQLRPFDVVDLPLLNAFLDTPRELFLPAAFAPLAYSDVALSVKGDSETRWVPPPLVLARFLQAASLRPGQKILDVGGGSGYAAALESRLVAQVTLLESDAGLATTGREALARAGAANVTVVTGALDRGVAVAAPFDVILIHGRVETGLDRLLAQLAPNGRLLTYRRSGAASGVRAVRLDRAAGLDAGEWPLFDAAAPALAAFVEAPGFRL